ncbi:hypothetical protein ACQR1W_31660 [Bradyrhizobium sp. HKCCYLS1011]|uniref:hypothetical protein n=1 Tax=Bradyrhizobium sp. HKCCYLS1011 TaxID=3420733 RepID=UPI003EB85837
MNGCIVWKGPSEIDGQPIMLLATGLEDGGSNSKTGAMAQLYILRQDIGPLQASQIGADKSICGSCVHMGKVVTDPKTGLRKNVGRSCYVMLWRGPHVVFDAYQRGVYPEVTLAKARKLLAGKRVRAGAYGDPGAIPMAVWETILAKVKDVTGFTHMWREKPELAAFCMASCDTEIDRVLAKALGFRTYRVRPEGAPKLAGEGHCPASKEMGKATQCAQCLLCGGHKSKAKADITIQVHGPGRNNFQLALEAA